MMRLVEVLILGLFQISAIASPTLGLLQKIHDAATRSSLDPKFVEAIVKVESNFSPHATSHKGAMGLMQVMPTTADQCDVQVPYHALDNLMGACECLRKLINRYRGNLRLALAAYNAGTKAVERHQGVPPFPETQKYIQRIMEIYDRLRIAKSHRSSRK